MPAQEGGARGAIALPVEEAEVETEDGYWNNWLIKVSGFCRGNMRVKLLGLGSERVTAYGVDQDIQYNVWQNRNFNIWSGIGGTFCPRQKMSDGCGASAAHSEHQVSEDGYTTYDFNYRESSHVSLGFHELAEWLSVGKWRNLTPPM